MMMFEYINKTYNVVAKKKGRIKFQGKPGTIVGAKGAYLRIRLDGEKDIKSYHPTWEIEYVKE